MSKEFVFMSDKKKPLTKSQLLATLSEHTELSKKQVSAVLEALQATIVEQLGKKGPGIFTLPGLLKMKVRIRPATKAREGINPFTGQKQMFAAKPASKTVRANALKAFKEAIK
jgi:DNA-binding protein HU-beta